ncbi:MAG: flagellar biosynthesis protein FlhA [Miltoncostaeaceae bacterium]|jgi:flagellar biosynthesis protein FlhA|nr:flagellar biosynthesis protein FlhA [Miltoncostaeaceae bacterium]
MDGLMKRLLRHSDLAAAFAVVIVVLMMIVPLPSALIDLAITLNIAGALAIVIASMYVPRALDFASFPSLLLLTTLLRLAINVSVTRLVLLHGDAGSVIHAFGTFVVGGNLVVGLVVFFILVVIQFVVITNGAGRVAEVAARFTLDAMPGKQMAIDADLNAGQITDEEARERREEIRREADFYGAMDGASKFVKGDAIAGVVIVAINLLGGILIGVMQLGMSTGDAAHTFSLLTIGDGLAAQIPALLISTATGIIVTRSGSKADLGREVTGQILGQPKALMLSGGFVAAMALIPGLPKIPFLLVGGLLLALGRTSMKARKEEAEAKAAADAPKELAPPGDAAVGALSIDPLELAIGFGLVPLVDQRSGGALLARVGVVRRQIASDLGIVIAPVRIHDDVVLDSHEYVVKVRGAEVARARVVPGHRLAMNPGDALPGLTGIPAIDPAFGLPAVWIDEAARADAEALGYTVVDPESVIVTHLTEVIRRHADELLTRQETRKLLDQLKEENSAAVEDVVPDKLGVGEVQRVLQHLLREGVSVRDLGTVLEAIGDRAMLSRDPSVLAESARQALGRTITAAYLDEEKALYAISLDPDLEREIADALVPTPEGEVLAIDPNRAAAMLRNLADQVDGLAAGGRRPVVLCSSRIRRHVRRLVEQTLPQLPVIAYNEVVPGIRLETAGVLGLTPMGVMS